MRNELNVVRSVTGKILSRLSNGRKAMNCVAAALLECEEEEGAVAVQWAAQSEAVLFAIERRILDRRERIARLESAVSQKPKDVAVKIVRATLGHDVDHAASATAKLRRERV